MTDIATVRRYTGDRATLHRQQFSGNTDQTIFSLDAVGIAASPAPRVWVDDTLKVETTDYTIDLDNGILTFGTAPTVNADILVEYTSAAFTDEEITAFLEDAGGNTTLASAYLLWVWAAIAAQSSVKETRSGGAGFGLVTVDTSVRSRELRLSAQALYDRYALTAGAAVAADSWTEFAWTQQIEPRYAAMIYARDVGGIAVS